MLPEIVKSRQSNRLLGLTIGFSMVMSLLVLWPHLGDKYRVTWDVQNFYWMARFQDSALFTNDHYYFAIGQVVELDIFGFPLVVYLYSLGYGLLFFLASFLIDPIWFHKLLIFGLMPLGVIYFFRLGHLKGNPITAVSLSLYFIFFILASSEIMSPATGLQRGFAIPFLIIFAYYMTTEKYWHAATIIWLCSLIYLPIFPLLVVSYGLGFLKTAPPFIQLERQTLLPLVISLILSTLAVSLIFIPESSFATVSDAPVSENPAYQPGGIRPLFFVFPIIGRAGLFETSADALNQAILCLLSGLVYVMVGRSSLQKLPGIFWQILVAGTIMFFASLIAIYIFSSFALYLPSRYSRNALFITSLCFIGLNWDSFLSYAPAWFYKKRGVILTILISLPIISGIVYLLSPVPILVWPMLLMAGLFMMGLLTPLGASLLFWLLNGQIPVSAAKKPGAIIIVGSLTLMMGVYYAQVVGLKTINPPPAEREIYEFVATLPKDVLLAGTPDIMTNIPLFSRRSVLFRGLFPRGTEPIIEYFEAQYAEAPAAILTFCQTYHVDYLIINRTEFTPTYLADQNFFFQPYNDTIVEVVAGRSDFVLPHLETVFTSDPFAVIKCNEETVLGNE